MSFLNQDASNGAESSTQGQRGNRRRQPLTNQQRDYLDERLERERLALQEAQFNAEEEQFYVDQQRVEDGEVFPQLDDPLINMFEGYLPGQEAMQEYIAPAVARAEGGGLLQENRALLNNIQNIPNWQVFASFGSPSVIIPTPNTENTIPFVVTQTYGRNNSAHSNRVDTNILHYIYLTYENAFNLAGQRLGLAPNERGGRVRVFIQGMPLMLTHNEEETNELILDSPNVIIEPNDPWPMVVKLYDSLQRKFMNTYRTVSGINVEFIARPAEIMVRYEFSFFERGRYGEANPYDFDEAMFNFQDHERNIREQQRQEYAQYADDIEGGVNDDVIQNARPAVSRLQREMRRLETNLRDPRMVNGRRTRNQDRMRENEARLRARVVRVERELETTLRNQGAIYNRQTRSGRVRVYGETSESLLGRAKNSVFIKGKFADFFMNNNDLIGVPFVKSKICFPMAFLASQCRCVEHKWDADLFKAEEEIKGIYTHEAVVLKDIIAENRIGELGLVETFFFKKRSIYLFNPKKEKLEACDNTLAPEVYKNELDSSEDVKKTWVFCAMFIHRLVEKKVGKPIDVNDLDECLRAYAFAFEVSISVYRVGYNKRLYHEKAEFEELQRYENFISMVISGEHLHGIADLCVFKQPPYRKLMSHHVCDYCDDSNFKWRIDCEHQQECQRSHQSIDGEKEAKMKNVWKMDSLFLYYQNRKEEEKYSEMCMRCRRPLTLDPCCECEVPMKDFRYPNEAYEFFKTGATPPEKMKEIKKHEMVTCKRCNANVSLEWYNKHICYMRAKELKSPLKNEKIFVYDIESNMKEDVRIGQEVHVGILFYMMAVYDEREWWFRTVDEFMTFLLTSDDMKGATVLAHNGGGYDHLFLVRYMEENCMAHRTIPRPNSTHKYLRVDIQMKENNDNITLLDFFSLVPDSLRNIAKAFKLPTLKGDFPHKFSTPEHMEYEGPLPKITHPKDWYGLEDCRTEKEKKDSLEYWTSQSEKYCYCHGHECVCAKPKWNYYNELKSYCRVDVVVLKEAVKRYRDEMLSISGGSDFNWEANPIDPLRYMTQSQIALALFTKGKHTRDVYVSHEKIRASFRPNQIHWMEDLMKGDSNLRIQHAGNSRREWFDTYTQSYVDGYCPRTRTMYEYFDCRHDACPRCFKKEIDSGEMNPERNLSWKDINEYREKRLMKLQSNCTKVVRFWSHDDKEEWKERRDGHIMKMRDFFYGGRTEVFAAFCDITKRPGWNIFYDDVCSEYPFVCSHRKMPIGVPKVFFGNKIDKERLDYRRPDRYFGFARIRVTPNKNDFIAILPARIEKDGDVKLVYDLLEKEGCWHTEMIYLAQERGYVVEEIYEVIHWDEDQCSMDLMKGYMEFFLRMKQQADGWEDLGEGILKEYYDAKGQSNYKPDFDNLTTLEKDIVCDRIYELNGGMARPDPAKVDKNPVKRKIGKNNLNCLWGKLCQRGSKVQERIVHNYQEYMEIMNDPEIDPETIRMRHIHAYMFKANYTTRGVIEEDNPFLSIPIAASVTAHAQVLLMRQMVKIGQENLLYCDTDSIIFMRKDGEEELNSAGLGNWEREYKGETITQFLAIAPKCYMIKTSDEYQSLKCKGVRLNLKNQELLSFESLKKLVKGAYDNDQLQEAIQTENMIIHPNCTNKLIPYGSLCTLRNTKDVGVVYSKRDMMCKGEEGAEFEDLTLLRLQPFGYEGNLKNI